MPRYEGVRQGAVCRHRGHECRHRRLVEINEKCRTRGSHIQKGDEVGLFQFGGSGIIVAFEKGRIEFDEGLLEVSQRQVMMDVEVGMSLGTARKP